MRSPLLFLRSQPEVHAFSPSVWLSGFERFTVEFPWGELQQHCGFVMCMHAALGSPAVGMFSSSRLHMAVFICG